MDESYFQNRKRCFETLKFGKSFQKLQIFKHQAATPSHLSWLHWEVFLCRSSRETALQKSRDAQQELVQQNALHTHLWVRVHVEIFIWNWIWSSSWTEGGKHSSVCLYLLTCLPGTPESLLVSCYKGLFRNSCHWRSLIKDSQHCDFPEERGPWFSELSNLSLSIEMSCKRKHSSCWYFCSLNLSPSNTSFSLSFKRVKVTPCMGALQAHCWPRERRGAWFPCL